MKIIFSFCRRSSMKIFRRKTTKKRAFLGPFSALFFAINFHFYSQSAPKNNFHMKSLLETCSETSNYPQNTLSRHQDTYRSLYMTKRKIFMCERANFCKSATFRHFLGGFQCNSSILVYFQQCSTNYAHFVSAIKKDIF